MAYQIVIEKKALKFLASVPKRDYLKLKEHIYQLAEDPQPSGSIKLHGAVSVYRLRYGNYRILYTIQNDQLIVYIIEIGNRKDNLPVGTLFFSIAAGHSVSYPV